MQDIKDVVKEMPLENDVELDISNLKGVELESYFYNQAEGELNLEDGINCDICKNKGNISSVINGFEKIKECECMKRRKMYHRFMETGISKDQFKRYTFNNFKATNLWQKECLGKALNFCDDLINNKQSYWFYIGGNSGTGKTHLCTSIITKLLNNNYEVKYMVWNTELPSLISQRKSFYQEEQDLYKHRVKELKECQVLYIDDFLQLDTETKESLSIAYEIINSRYTDDSKITIISSEIDEMNLFKLSKALCGRFIEKGNKGKYFISISENTDNYRMRKEG